ncbi:hypothetical protein CKAH01_15056 [Colletotrichum kahawae]|uniref:Uncharacterized protein n=1 Tax=Colletotrichum kahawae TaxID=34407 RepID=A0AAE0D987_COLKA|nr:hypothetical protein CKAH01_15056 [Colletotrichum kahawae]
MREVCNEDGDLAHVQHLRTFLDAKTSVQHDLSERHTSRASPRFAKRRHNDIDSFDFEDPMLHREKRQRCTSPTDRNLAASTRLVLDERVLQDLRKSEIPESSLMCNPRSNPTSFESPKFDKLLGALEAIGKAVQVSNQWRYERKRNDERTNCLTALISDTEEEDVSFVLRLARVPAFTIIKFLDFVHVGTFSSAKNPDR